MSWLMHLLSRPALGLTRPTSSRRRVMQPPVPASGHARTALALTVACVVVFGGCRRQNQYQPPPPPTVTVSHPLQQDVTEYQEETGWTEAVERVEIRARVTGFLEQIRFEPGRLVEKGETLFIIEQRPFKASVAVAEASLAESKAQAALAETEFKRAEALLAKRAVSKQEYDEELAKKNVAEAQVLGAEAALEQAKIDLDYTDVKTPISGRVGQELVKLGNLVEGTNATHLTTVIQYDPIYAYFNISERALLEIMDKVPASERRKDDDPEPRPLFLKRANDEGFPFEGKVDFADLGVDQSTGTYLVRGLFPNSEQKIVPGLFVRVRIPIGVAKNALIVPERAVTGDQAGKFVLIVNSEEKVERRNVTLGIKAKGMVVISEGLRADDRVVVDGIQRARPGVKVKAVQAKPEEMPTLEQPTSTPVKPAEKPATKPVSKEKPAEAKTPKKASKPTPPAPKKAEPAKPKEKQKAAPAPKEQVTPKKDAKPPAPAKPKEQAPAQPKSDATTGKQANS